MKKIISLFLLALLQTAVIRAADFPVSNNISAEPRVILDKMWIDYDATENGVPGMRMHTALTVHNMKGIEGTLIFYFKYSDGKPDSFIKDLEVKNKYHNTDGFLFTSATMIPNYDVTIYDDFEVFMPYNEFTLAPGEHDITIDVRFFNTKTVTWIAWLKLYDIILTQPDNSRSSVKQTAVIKNRPVVTSGPRAEFDSLWVDFDVEENNELGMDIHFKFVTYDMKDTAAAVAIFFLHNSNPETTLRDKNQKYLSSAGDVAIYRDINPGYDTAYYNDLVLFMPYAELDLSPGTYELVMDTKVIYSRGGLISNFVYQPFRFTQPAR